MRFSLEDRELLHIFNLSDIHWGSNHCNQSYVKYAFKHIKELKGNIIINVLGDIFECASLRVGNSAFKQTLSINEQLELGRKMFGSLFERPNIYPGFFCIGNHEARLIQDNDFNLMEEFARSLKMEYHNNLTEKDIELNDNNQFICSPYVVDKYWINDKSIKIYGTHGTGSAKRLDLAMSKIQRDTDDVDADIISMGHLHRCHSFPKYMKTSRDEGGMKIRYYQFTGHFLSYRGSYANNQSMSILPEAFSRLDLVDAHGKLHVSHKDFFIHRYRPDLFKI